MLKLIGKAMGKPIAEGRDTFEEALSTAGLEHTLDEFDDLEDEGDGVGDWVLGEEAAAAD